MSDTPIPGDRRLRGPAAQRGGRPRHLARGHRPAGRARPGGHVHGRGGGPAGVGKATVYRRWRSRGALALDAFMAEFKALQPLPDTGTLRGDLLAALRAWVRAVTQTPAGRIRRLSDRRIAVTTLSRPPRGGPRHTWNRCGGSTGSCCGARLPGARFPASTDMDVALDLLYGAAYHRLLQGHRPLSENLHPLCGPGDRRGPGRAAGQPGPPASTARAAVAMAAGQRVGLR